MLELREENLSEFDLLSLEDLGDDQPQNPQARKGELLVDTDHLRTLILPELSSMPVEIDELIRMLGLPSAHAHGTFLELELEGLITRLPGNRICLKSVH